MINELTSAEAFAKTVRDSHGWPEESISTEDCCECEHSSWLAWGRAWTAATQAKDTEIAALTAERDNALNLWTVAHAERSAEIMRGAEQEVEIAALKAELRQESHDICMSRSLSLSRDGKHAEANEASKCASAVKYAKLDAAMAQAAQP